MSLSQLSFRHALISAAFVALAGCGHHDSDAAQNSEAALNGNGGISATLKVSSDWGSGYCADVTVSNSNPSANTSTWSVVIALNGSTSTQNWNSTFSGTTGNVTATPAGWNNVIPHGGSTSFGFCANRSSAGQTPNLVSVTSDLPNTGTGGAGGTGGSGGSGATGGSSGSAGSGGTGGSAGSSGGSAGSGGSTCTEGGAPSVTQKVELRANSVDDWIYLTVDGVQRKTWHIGDADIGSRIDVTSWFAQGANDVRIQGFNEGGPAALDIEFWVDGVSVNHQTCAAPICDGITNQPQGNFFDKTISIQTPGLPPKQHITFANSAVGKLYVNDAYTGLSTPASLDLPRGSYTIGLGVGDQAGSQYVGKFYEQTLNVGNCPKTVDFSASTALSTQNTTRIAVVPVRNAVYDGDASDTAVLKDSDIPVLTTQIESTRTTWVKPYSYGLTDWHVDLKPTVETTPLHRGASPDIAPDTDRFINEAGLSTMVTNYDIVVFFYSSNRADGSPITHSECCVWTGGKYMSFQSSYLSIISPIDSANVYFFHETLHSYEWYNSWGKYGQYNGVDGLHGSGPHGYVFGGNGEADFLQFYRAFVRGQVAELDGMRSGTTWPSIPPTGDVYVGPFKPFRRGVLLSAPPPSQNGIAPAAPRVTARKPPVIAN